MNAVDIIALCVIGVSVVSTVVLLIRRRIKKKRDGQSCGCGCEGCNGCGDRDGQE
ncbi:MAG: FeoB-associated Cys-rich membrane protein [Eubacteriales bacterium]